MTQTFDHGYALLIGVGECSYDPWSLPVTVKDMRALRDLLVDSARCAYPDEAEHVRLLHDQGATRQAILAGLDWLKQCAQRDPDATIVVYYSGHGWLNEANGRYYLIPHDVEPFDLAGSALAATDFNDGLRGIPAKRLLVFIDSCHAEGMASAKVGMPVRLPSGFVKSAPPSEVLSVLQEGEGRAVFTSSRGHQLSWIRRDGNLSVFTHHLLEALQGAGNRPGETEVRLSHLMNHLDRMVASTAMQMYNAEQRPFVNLASEDFAVALLHGGKGLPAGGWPDVAAQAQGTIARLVQVEGDRNIVGDVTDSLIQMGDHSIATGGGDHVAGNKRVVWAKTYIETLSIGEDKAARLAQAREEYLTLLRNRCQVLPMAAVGGEDGLRDAVRLQQVYVDLDTTTPISKPDDAAVSPTREEREPLSAMAAATRESRLVLLGDPGSGKSTFVRQLAVLLIDAAVGGGAPPDGWTPGTLPVLVNLRELAPRLADLELAELATDERNKRLIRALHEQWEADVASLPMATEAAMEVLDVALRAGAVLVVFDGLDEVPEGARAQVGWMLTALMGTYPEIGHTLVTCRVRSYVGDAVLAGFADHRLAPFDKEKIQRFVQGWYQAQVDLGRLTEQVAKERRKDLVEAALSSALQELAQNPMLLTTMAIIHQRDVGLPKERVRLYHQAVTVLLHRWQRHRGVWVSKALAAQLADELKMRTILERLAHDAHERERRQEGSLRFGTLIEVLSGPAYLNDLALAGEFLRYVDEKAGVLVGEGGSERAGQPVTYRFPHRTFQEYLAGCHLIGDRPSARALRPYAAEGDFWSLAAQLAGEELLYNRRQRGALLDVMYDLCPTSEPVNVRDWRTALWSAQMAKLIGAGEVAKDDEPGGGAEFLGHLTARLVSIVDRGLLTPPERADAGRILSLLGDPRPGVGVVDSVPDILWCAVPGGEFTMGADDITDDERPVHRLRLDRFRMAKYPVTNAQYAAFVAATGHAAPRHWQGGAPPAELANHPVVNVTWHDAMAFCVWLSKVSGEEVRLPSEAQWEKAAKGGQGNSRYPWGDEEPDESRCNFDDNIGGTTTVGMYSVGDSPYGCCDMSGNVWEWTRSLWGERFGDAEFGYPYDPADGRESIEAPDSVQRVLRGGAFFNLQLSVRCAFRYRNSPDLRLDNIGFRVLAPGR